MCACSLLLASTQTIGMREPFSMCSAGISVTWADRTLATSTAKFGAQQVGPEHQDAEIVLGDPLDGSANLTNTNAAGKIVLVMRGGVPFVEKAANAQAAGAIAAIIYNSQYAPMDLSRPESTSPKTTIPVFAISQADGAQLAAAIGASRTTLSLQSAFCQSLFTMFISHVSIELRNCLAAADCHYIRTTSLKHDTAH